MPEEVKKTVTYDVDGYDIVTKALETVLNTFPGLQPTEKIKFSSLKEDEGIAFYPVSGAVVASEKKYITGIVDQLCNYPFYIVYRSAPTTPGIKTEIKEFLDTLGKWLEKQPVQVDGKEYHLESYSTLTEGRVIESITRLTPSYLDTVAENKVEDWVISMSLKYRKKFKNNHTGTDSAAADREKLRGRKEKTCQNLSVKQWPLTLIRHSRESWHPQAGCW